MIEPPHRDVQNDILLRYFAYPLLQYTPFRFFLGMYNKIEYKGGENLKELKDKNFMMICQHQRLQDIPYNDIMIRKLLNDFGHFIMKGSLPNWFFSPFRGIRVIRKKDVAKGKFSDEERKERNRHVYENIIPRVLKNNEGIVIYPEGTRFRYGNKTEIREQVLDNLVRIQLDNEVPINFVVVGSNYGENARNIYKPLSKIEFTIGKSFQVPNDMSAAVSKLEEEISKVFTKEVSFITDNLQKV